MKRVFNLLVLSALVLGLFAVPTLAAGNSRAYIVMASGNGFSAGLQAGLVGAGASINRVLPELGMAFVTSNVADFSARAARLSGVRSVVPDVVVQWIDPNLQVVEVDFANPPSSGDDDTLFDLQWGHDAVDAVEAWNAGYFGAGVRVAVLDSGIDAEHPDIAPNLNAALSASFVPGEHWNVRPGVFFSHGTHVAGTIAAADNGIGVIGVAPQAEIVAVKVLSEYTGSGSFSGVIEGIYYAAMIDADIINMSLGALLPRHGWIDDNGTPEDPSDDFRVIGAEVAELSVATGRAVTWATQMGTTVIVAEGNDYLDKDHTGDWITLPADLPHALSIAATAPVGWALDPGNVFLDNHASYSNYGKSAVDFAAPGGDFVYPGNENCTVAGRTRPCWVFDLVMSSGSQAWYWAAGTSMAAPHVSGVAAIIIGMNGGDMSPAHVEAALRRSADDLGKPGNDEFYGGGRVNAGNTVP